MCAGGLPIGAVLMQQHVADAMTPGDHGSTFAGNPLVCAAAVATFDIISEPAFLQEVQRKGEKLRGALRDATAGNAHVLVRANAFSGVPCCERCAESVRALSGRRGVQDVRGSGLICGVQLDQAAGGVVEKAREAGVIVITAGAGDVIRLVPPLTCLDEEIDTVVGVIAKCLSEL